MRKMVLMMLVCQLLTGRAYAATVTTEYRASEAELVNPYIGNAIWADEDGAEQPFTLVYANLLWSELEKDEGVYDFSKFEESNQLDRWSKEGKKLVLRFVMDIPMDQKHRDIPDWLYEKTGGNGKNYHTEYGRGYCPDYSDPILIQAHAKAVAAIGRQYGQDGFLAYVQLGSLGHWGEWHVHQQAGTMPDAEVRAQYVQAYVDAFPKAKLLMRRPFTPAATYGMGLYNDTAGNLDSTERWLDWIENGGPYDQTGEEDAIIPMRDAWKTAPIGGELATNEEPEDLLREELTQTIALFESSHTSWIGPRSFATEIERDGELQAALDSVNRRIGYRLRVMEASFESGPQPKLKLRWTNDGIAPFYFDWEACIRLTWEDGKTETIALEMTLADVLPGSVAEVDVALPEGSYGIEAGILDPETGRAGVALAMDVAHADGWYRLMSVKQ